MITQAQVTANTEAVTIALNVIGNLVGYQATDTAMVVVVAVRATLLLLGEAIEGKIDPEIVRIQLADLVDNVREAESPGARFDDGDVDDATD